MNKSIWITKKNYLCNLIKKVSDSFGGDDIEFLRQYCREVLEIYPFECIEEPIRCFEEIYENIH